MFQHFTKDSVVSERGCFLFRVIITPRDTKKGDITLYNGLNAGGMKIANLRTSTGHSALYNFGNDFYCAEGLYLDVGGDVEGVLVVWG